MVTTDELARVGTLIVTGSFTRTDTAAVGSPAVKESRPCTIMLPPLVKSPGIPDGCIGAKGVVYVEGSEKLIVKRSPVVICRYTTLSAPLPVMAAPVPPGFDDAS